MSIPRTFRILVSLAVLAGLGIALFVTRQQWAPWLAVGSPAVAAEEEAPAPVEEAHMLKLTPQARKNLELVSKPATLADYWRTIDVPGIIVDRPGISEQGVTSPAVGVVTQVHAIEGDTVRAGEPLFTLRLFSEYLQSSQSELFKATRETELIKKQRERLAGVAESGAIAQVKVIELENQLSRQNALIQAHRQNLLTRGLTPEQIAQVSQGNFVSTIEVAAPPSHDESSPKPPVTPVAYTQVDSQEVALAYEVEELHVGLGQQVQAGQLLSTLSNHRLLYIEGHAFKRDAPFLENAAQLRWPVDVEFTEDIGGHWPPLDQTFRIRHLANSIDPVTRTFDFYLPLANQSHTYQADGEIFVVWRFRPGQRVRLHVPVEEFQEVFVLPSAAVVHDGPEAYVFQQNGDLFNRIPMHILYEDRRNVVLEDDGSITPGSPKSSPWEEKASSTRCSSIPRRCWNTA